MVPSGRRLFRFVRLFTALMAALSMIVNGALVPPNIGDFSSVIVAYAFSNVAPANGSPEVASVNVATSGSQMGAPTKPPGPRIPPPQLRSTPVKPSTCDATGNGSNTNYCTPSPTHVSTNTPTPISTCDEAAQGNNTNHCTPFPTHVSTITPTPTSTATVVTVTLTTTMSTTPTSTTTSTATGRGISKVVTALNTTTSDSVV